MESEKLPEFSEDGDHHRRNPAEKMEKAIEQPSSKRSYECVFCKRGFTNAQALGGHMNIHRKQRPNSKSSSSSKQLPNPNPNPNPNLNPSPAATVNRVTGPFHFINSSDNVPDSFESALKSKLSKNLAHAADASRENLGSDLSLQIGSSRPKNNEEDVDPNIDEEEERDLDIDLELRLGRGHHP